ncbi:hypothetical protein BCR41DRAFT_61607 [Lobosporangium transversale]|uniref:SAC3/GANP/Nin1/mts3/eIF-3 p25 family-domain-containing protein n=1 Tax=Lobosporangium transversale TaxID=64571 RepID=A0A1Y2GN17_9FUNG|nr:hypothetical protein BCR41DRAFT_61607 [Lobosporangium transversale]ORZ16159.1 hypothetical protein BCR41DRAFT_61607 [Lobosporangium transversale]|eukprot:XP_021881506.1 hypothetical protein BCR41DRAFT_61607 [Lobosporangium transversale]
MVPNILCYNIVLDRSSHSLKTRSVQERVFSEIKAMILRYEDRYGDNKLEPIPPRTQQAEAIDKIVESFRKLREGLFSTETRDAFAAEVYEESVRYSLYAGNIPELTKALHYLVQDLHPVVYKIDSTTPLSLTIPIKRQRFLGLYILFYLARPAPSVVGKRTGPTPTAQTMVHPKTETDRLIVQLLNVYDQYRKQQLSSSFSLALVSTAPISKISNLCSELLFAFTYWKSLREGNWVQRERLLTVEVTGLPQQQQQQQQQGSATWEQRLIIQYSIVNSLNCARANTVAMMSKAYYSLPITSMARAVGLTGSNSESGKTVTSSKDNVVASVVDEKIKDQWLKKMQASYGLNSSIVIRDDQLMFKAKA